MKIFFTLLFIICTKAFAQSSSILLKSKIDSMIATEMPIEKAVGVAIGIVKEGKIWYNMGYGTKELNANKPIDSLTNFHMASISKLFVATAIMQLVEKGKISLDAKLLDYITVDKLKDQRFKSVTIKHLLTHTSGIPDTDHYNWSKPKYDSLALGKYCIQYIQTKKLRFEPGTKFEYSNVAFNMLGHVIETITKKTFEAYEYNEVLNKAGLTHSDFEYSKIDLSRRSSPHILRLWKVKVSKIYPYNREHSPSGTLNSCTYDMCQWILEMLKIYNDTTNSYNGVISHSSLKELWSVKNTSFGPNQFVGLGWWLEESPYGLWTWGTGGDLGYKCILDVYPEQKTGIIMLINGEYPKGNLLAVPEFIAKLLLTKVR